MSSCIPTDRARAGRADKQNSSSSGGDRQRHLLYGVPPVVYVAGSLKNRNGRRVWPVWGRARILARREAVLVRRGYFNGWI
jgi:hypothetical protein